MATCTTSRAPAYGRYFAYHALFLLSMNVLVVAPNLLQLFVGWELVGVTSYLLIGFYFRKPSAARAAQKAFWVTKFADMGFLVGLLVLFVASGSFGWDARLAPGIATAVTLLFFLAVVGKSAQFPLHVWLPDAMEGPTPVSALLHAATMVAAGVFLVVRADPLFAQAPATRTIMLGLGAATALFAACLALVQTDIKKVLAYSTCSQLGYMVAALGAGSVLGGFFHLTTHAFFKALLFLAAGSAIHAVHSNDIGDMGGLAKRMPLTAAAFVVGALALAGIPGFSGFFSKDLVLEAVEGKLGSLPWAALLATAFLTAFYMGRVVFVAFFGKPSGDGAEHAHEPGWSMRGPLVVLAILAAGGGLLAAPFAKLYGAEYHFEMGVGPSLGAALGLGGLAARLPRLRQGTARRLAGSDGPGGRGSRAHQWSTAFYELATAASPSCVADGLGVARSLRGRRRHQPARLRDPRGGQPRTRGADRLRARLRAGGASGRGGPGLLGGDAMSGHLLSIIVAAPALAALVVMLLPAGARLGIRLVSLTGAAVSLAGSIAALVGYDRAAGGFQRVEDYPLVPAFGVHLRFALDGWGGPAAAAHRHHHLRRRARELDA